MGEPEFIPDSEKLKAVNREIAMRRSAYPKWVASRGVDAVLAMPFADTQAMQAHIDEIGWTVARGAHAVLLLDRAGWHTTDKLEVPKNMTLIMLPSRSPELNPVENVWQYLRANWLSNRIFETYGDILDAACEAWNKLTAMPAVIRSIRMRESAHNGEPLGLQHLLDILPVEFTQAMADFAEQRERKRRRTFHQPQHRVPRNEPYGGVARRAGAGRAGFVFQHRHFT